MKTKINCKKCNKRTCIWCNKNYIFNCFSYIKYCSNKCYIDYILYKQNIKKQELLKQHKEYEYYKNKYNYGYCLNKLCNKKIIIWNYKKVSYYCNYKCYIIDLKNDKNILKIEIIKNCYYCKKDIKINGLKTKRFCNYNCYYKYIRLFINKKCLYCKKKVKKYQYKTFFNKKITKYYKKRLKTKYNYFYKYCNNNCCYLNNEIINKISIKYFKKCGVCFNTFITINNNNLYCSKSCSSYIKNIKYYENNKEYLNKQHKQYRLKNKEKIKEYQKEYREKNKQQKIEIIKKCLLCNKDFKTINKNKKYCCIKCKWKNNYNKNKKEKIRLTKKCFVCLKEFKTTLYNKCYCSNSCKYKNNYKNKKLKMELKSNEN